MPDTVCSEHNQVPASVFDGGPCYGPLFICKLCQKPCCAGFGAADEYFDYCDNCYVKLKELENQGLNRENIIIGT